MQLRSSNCTRASQQMQRSCGESRRTRCRRTRSWSLHVKAQFGDGENSALERITAAVPYTLPLLDSLRFGTYFFQSFPTLAAVVIGPIAPLAQIYFRLPFASLAFFFAVYLGIVRNTNTFSRFVRVNAMQAVTLDILLILPSLVENLFRGASQNPLFAAASSSVFMFVLVSFVYASFSCLLGRAVRLPLVGEAAESQVPF